MLKRPFGSTKLLYSVKNSEYLYRAIKDLSAIY